MLSTLTHLALHVHDLEETVEFYNKYCSLHVIHDRKSPSGSRVVWMARQGQEKEFIFVFISGGPPPATVENDYSHLGFALNSKSAVDQIAHRAREEAVLRGNREKNPILSGIIAPSKIRRGIS